jgi:hypothetical protein
LARSSVGVLVEVPEQEPEEYGVNADPPHEATRIIAFAE